MYRDIVLHQTLLGGLTSDVACLALLHLSFLGTTCPQRKKVVVMRLHIVRCADWLCRLRSGVRVVSLEQFRVYEKQNLNGKGEVYIC